MEVFGTRLLLEPTATATTVAFILGGVVVGTISGLTPGIHVNNLALLLASMATSVAGPPRLVGAAILSAGVVHSFLDVVPALTLGVPDPVMAATALPGHRLVIEGRGREAIRLSALGSGLAVAFAVPLALPVTMAMTDIYPLLRTNLPFVLVCVVVFLVLTEPTTDGKIGALVAFCASSVLGILTLPLSPTAPLGIGGVLTPLFAGLFGAPVLVDAMGGTGVPEQGGTTLSMPRTAVALTALAGSFAGAIVGYLPGVSSAIAAVLALALVPRRTEARGFIVASSGVNTANTIFALFALLSLGTPRTGVMVALRETNAPLDMPVLLASVAIAGVVGFALVFTLGDTYLETVGGMNYRRLSVGVLCLLVGSSFLFGGVVGVGLFVCSAVFGPASAAIGMSPSSSHGSVDRSARGRRVATRFISDCCQRWDMIPLFGPVPGGVEMMVILLVALVLFGLPLTLIALFLTNRSKGGSATKDDVDELANEVAELRTQLEERDRTGQQEKE